MDLLFFFFLQLWTPFSTDRFALALALALGFGLPSVGARASFFALGAIFVQRLNPRFVMKELRLPPAHDQELVGGGQDSSAGWSDFRTLSPLLGGGAGSRSPGGRVTQWLSVIPAADDLNRRLASSRTCLSFLLKGRSDGAPLPESGVRVEQPLARGPPPPTPGTVSSSFLLPHL